MKLTEYLLNITFYYLKINLATFNIVLYIVFIKYIFEISLLNSCIYIYKIYYLKMIFKLREYEWIAFIENVISWVRANEILFPF